MAEERRWDPENPFERIKKLGDLHGESQRANTALRDYYAMEPARSLRNLAEHYNNLAEYYNKQSISGQQAKVKPTQLSTIFGWSSKFCWQERVAAQQILDNAEDERLWVARRREIREKDWEMAAKLRGVAVKILEEAPIFVKQQRRFIKGEEGQPDREVITMALNGNLGVKAAEAASKLARLAAEMENERQKVILAIEREADVFLDAAQQVLDESDFNRLLARLSGEAGGETATEEDPEPEGAEGEQPVSVAAIARAADDGLS